MTAPEAFDDDRLETFLGILEQMAAGDTQLRLPISRKHDELDAIAHAINVLVGELAWTSARMAEAQDARVAAAERAEASKTIFIRNMSHEIRTPIAAMIGFAELLLAADPSQAPPPDMLRRLQANGKAVLSLLDNLLDLAKLDADRITLEPETVPLMDLMQDVCASLEIERRANRVELRAEAADERLGSIVTDRFRLRQILVNLVANAVKFTRDGTVTLVVNTKREADGDHCTIDIIDTGIGIAAGRRGHIFEPFEQGDPHISQVYGGSGLGLTLSRRLARRLGGDLELLHSSPGTGSTFRLVLKSLPAAAAAQSDAHETPAPPAKGIKGMRILLAEDHRDLHLALRRMLEQAGATIASAFDGREAVDQASAAPFDVVLMDLRMPNLDGLAAARTLRGKGYTTPIVALTADPTTLWRAAALEAGCNDVLAKPFTIDHVAAAIRGSRPE
jgi:signal transduction histidine kinase